MSSDILPFTSVRETFLTTIRYAKRPTISKPPFVTLGTFQFARRSKQGINPLQTLLSKEQGRVFRKISSLSVPTMTPTRIPRVQMTTARLSQRRLNLPRQRQTGNRNKL